MTTPRELREKRANVWAQMQETRAAVDKDGWTAELRASWDRAEAALATLTDDIKRTETAEQIDKRFGEIDEQTRHVDAAGRETRSAHDEYADVFAKYVRSGRTGLDDNERQLLQANFRAQSSGTSNTGGYSVPQGFWAKVTETLKFYGGVEAAGATVINTDAGNSLPWPTVDDTSNVGAILSENTQVSGQDITFGQKSLGAFMYTSKLILASIQFLQDTGIDAESFIARQAGTRLGRIWNTHCTTGTATTQPQGCIVGATVGGTAAATGTVAYDDLVSLIHSVDVAYRTAGQCHFMMHDGIVSHIRKLKDTTGLPIWQPSVQVGTPDALLGYPVVINNDMQSTVATATKTVGFGNLGAAYVIRRVNGGQLLRLEERYADYLQVGFFAFGRLDAVTQDAGAFKTLLQP